MFGSRYLYEKIHVFLETEIRAGETADEKHTETKLKP